MTKKFSSKKIISIKLVFWLAGCLLLVIHAASIMMVSAEMSTFLVRDNEGSFYEYNSDALNQSFLSSQLNPESDRVKMYAYFDRQLKAGGEVIGLKDSVKGYMDYPTTVEACLKNQLAGQDFDINAYFAGDDAKVLAEEVIQLKRVDKDGQVTEIPDPVIEPVVYDKAGTFGPATGSETIAGDVTVNADGVILQNLVIQGNLTISEAVGDGNVTLNNVTVVGDTFVRGGGKNSIKITGGEYSRIVMEKTASGAVRIVATGVDGLDVVISEDASGETIILEGAFESVTVNAPNMAVTTQGNTTTIGKMTVGAGAAGSTITVAVGTTVSDLVLDGKAAVKGQGTVTKAEVNADSVVFDKKPGAYTVEPGVVIPPVFPTPDNGGGSGGGYTPPAPVAVTGVSLNKNTANLKIGDSETLVATVAPTDATNKTVSWESSDKTVATVNPTTGLVTAITVGTTRVTVTSEDGNKQAVCEVTVAPIAVTGVSLNQQNLNLVYNATETLVATVLPANAANKAVSFTSSNLAVATVDPTTGLITTVGAGSATITVTTTDGGFTASCLVTVTLPALPTEIKGIPIPFAGDHPVMTITETDQYSGTVTWKEYGSNLTADSVFDGSKWHEAVITLTLKEPYHTDLISTNYFTVPGATAYNNSNSLKIYATFTPFDQYRVESGVISAYSGIGGILALPTSQLGVDIIGIGTDAFKNRKVTEINLPDAITTIGSGAFAGNTLTKITLGANVTIPDDTAMGGNGASFKTFYETESGGVSKRKGNYYYLNSAWYYSGNQLGQLWFDETGQLTAYVGTDKNLVIPDGTSITAIAPQALAGRGLSSLSLPAAVKTIGDGAFKGNTLGDISIGDGVTVGADDALGKNTVSFLTAYAAHGAGNYHCYYDLLSGLPSWTFSDVVVNGIAFNKASQTINSYKAVGGNLIIPASFDGVAAKIILKNSFREMKITGLTFDPTSQVETIGAGAFYLNNIPDLVLPASLKSIGGSAFESCRINRVKLPDGLKTIDVAAFFNNQLTTITIPASVTSIGQQAFVANKLTEVVIEGSDGAALTIGAMAFQSLNAESNLITRITIPANVTITDDAAMGKYGASFKAFYEDAAGNNKAGGSFSYDVVLNKWTKII